MGSTLVTGGVILDHITVPGGQAIKVIHPGIVTLPGKITVLKPFYPKVTDWFTYKSHFEAIASQAGWYPKTKCVKLMGALQGSLTGVTAGMKQPVGKDQLVALLDSVHGISNDRDDALIKISNCRKGKTKSMPMFGEKVRQLTERAYPHFSPTDKDEQPHRAC